MGPNPPTPVSVAAAQPAIANTRSRRRQRCYLGHVLSHTRCPHRDERLEFAALQSVHAHPLYSHRMLCKAVHRSMPCRSSATLQNWKPMTRGFSATARFSSLSFSPGMSSRWKRSGLLTNRTQLPEAKTGFSPEDTCRSFHKLRCGSFPTTANGDFATPAVLKTGVCLQRCHHIQHHSVDRALRVQGRLHASNLNHAASRRRQRRLRRVRLAS